MVRVLSFPCVMLAGFALFAALSNTGWPLLASAYLPVVMAAVSVALHERALPYRAAWRPDRREVAADLSFLIVVQLSLPYLLSLASVLWLADLTGDADAPLAAAWPHHWPVAAQAALMLLSADFLRYWMHRAFHRFAPLWRLHAVHHSPQRLYWLNVGRFHPLEKAVQFAADSLPFLALGVAEPVFAAYFIFFAINGFYQHSNCAVRLGPLNYLVSGPELHRWHHSRRAAESNTNFGNNLIVWDLLFGTRFLPADREVDRLGLRNRRYPLGFLNEMASPFVADPGADR